ncbi:transcription factor WhiB family protein [Mycobacterium kansasii]|uniref:Transcription factor WhiB family protein n=1 Tax=Mycobacterium kansasii TaxID=1768 RepID=A0A1V3WE43_MYCKA|nr:transcription factor WhiB family protein [Mycobacterium kansasii]
MIMTLREQQWRKQAVCYLETSDAPELWTPEHRPKQDVRVHLEQMCQRCPVRQACAADAVVSEAESGLYAGVWVPERRKKTQWALAMAKLAEVASLGAGAGEFTRLGVSA